MLGCRSGKLKPAELGADSSAEVKSCKRVSFDDNVTVHGLHDRPEPKLTCSKEKQSEI